jgi:pimeloyl-ACP methyl ester carboxylesterase
MGKSTLNEAKPYSVDNDVHILRTALQTCGIQAPIVVVAHSYGGAMALIAATEQPSVRGVVLLDALVPNVWPPSEVEKNLRMMRADYDAIRKEEPALAKVAIPWAEALPDTAKRINALVVSETLPITDVVAEKGRLGPESDEIWLKAHREFTSNHAAREYLFAAGSGHKVMVDKPELVLRAILKMLDRVGRG